MKRHVDEAVVGTMQAMGALLKRKCLLPITSSGPRRFASTNAWVSQAGSSKRVQRRWHTLLADGGHMHGVHAGDLCDGGEIDKSSHAG